MEIGNVLIGVISVVAIILPFVIMYRKSKSTERGLVKNLKEYANKNNFQLDKVESVAHLALGLDQKNRIAYFSEVEEGVFDTWHLNLSDRKSTRLNSSHVRISYAVFCLKKKKKKQ